MTSSFASGSTVFGNSADDTHVFTGSLFISGSQIQLDSNSKIGLSNNGSGDYNTLFGNAVGTPVSGQDHNTFIGHNVAATGTMTNAADYNTGIGAWVLNDLTSGASNTGLGYDALAKLTAGNNNVAIGATAADAMLDVDEVVVIGSKALSTATGNNHDGVVAVGAQALEALNVGDANGSTAVGYQAGHALTTGTTNTLLGRQALKTATTSSGSVMLGKSAGEAITTGNYNIGIGVSAMNSATTGNHNIAIGSSAGVALTSGYENVAIGYLAADVSTSTNALTAVGYQALSAATGVSNTAVGKDAGLTVTSGTNNLCLGVDAGIASSPGGAITTESNNICLGNGSGQSITDGNLNISIGQISQCEAIGGIAIGYIATVTGDNGIAIGTNISAATNVFVFGKSGNYATSSTFTSSGSCTFTFASDERRKTNIKDSVIGLDFINELKARTFNWKPAEEHPEEWHAWEDLKNKDGELTGEKEYDDIDTNSTMHGFVAQEIKEVLDKYNVTDSIDVWAEDENGMQRANENKLIIPLIKAVQELSVKIDTMQAQINNLTTE